MGQRCVCRDQHQRAFGQTLVNVTIERQRGESITIISRYRTSPFFTISGDNRLFREGDMRLSHC